MYNYSESDEIVAQPSSHPLRTVPLFHAYATPTAPNQTTMLLSYDSSLPFGVLFRRAARDLATRNTFPLVRFWFESSDPSTVHTATGIVQSWSDDGEITFQDGTRLNDALLLRVTF